MPPCSNALVYLDVQAGNMIRLVRLACLADVMLYSSFDSRECAGTHAPNEFTKRDKPSKPATPSPHRKHPSTQAPAPRATTLGPHAARLPDGRLRVTEQYMHVTLGACVLPLDELEIR